MTAPAGRIRTDRAPAPPTSQPHHEEEASDVSPARSRDCDVAARLATLVAERLGVDVGDLTPEVSLTDELAADSLDLADIEIGIEEELGLALPQRLLAEVRAYGDLVAAVLDRSRFRSNPTPAAGGHVLVRARVTRPPRSGHLERVLWLTPYAAEMIAEDALQGGDGARLELIILSSPSDRTIAWVRERFQMVADRGVRVDVHRDHAAARQRTARASGGPTWQGDR